MGHMPVLRDCGDVQGNRKQFQIKEPGGSRLIPSAEVGAPGQHSGAPGGPGGELLSLEEWRVEA